MSFNITCLVAVSSMGAILAMIDAPASTIICYCLALTISKLLGKHDPTSPHLALKSTPTGSTSTSNRRSRSDDERPVNETINPRILGDFLESCGLLHEKLHTHITRGRLELGRELVADPCPARSRACHRIQEVQASTLWLLYRTCSHLHARLSSLLAGWLLAVDSSKASPGSTRARSPAERGESYKRELKRLHHAQKQQGQQFSNVTHFSEVADIQPRSNGSMAGVTAYCHTQSEELLRMDASWHRHSVAVLRHGVMPGCGHARCRNTSGFSEAILPVQLCSGCRRVRYCSTACQRAAWVEGGHREVCRLWESSHV